MDGTVLFWTSKAKGRKRERLKVDYDKVACFYSLNAWAKAKSGKQKTNNKIKGFKYDPLVFMTSESHVHPLIIVEANTPTETFRKVKRILMKILNLKNYISKIYKNPAMPLYKNIKIILGDAYIKRKFPMLFFSQTVGAKLPFVFHY